MKYRIRIENEKEVIGYNVEKIIDEDTYSIEISIGLESIDGVVPPFSKTIIVISDNDQTGYEVDEQREQAITDYVNSINV